MKAVEAEAHLAEERNSAGGRVEKPAHAGERKARGEEENTGLDFGALESLVA